MHVHLSLSDKRFLSCSIKLLLSQRDLRHDCVLDIFCSKAYTQLVGADGGFAVCMPTFNGFGGGGGGDLEAQRGVMRAGAGAGNPHVPARKFIAMRSNSVKKRSELRGPCNFGEIK